MHPLHTHSLVAHLCVEPYPGYSDVEKALVHVVFLEGSLFGAVVIQRELIQSIQTYKLSSFFHEAMT